MRASKSLKKKLRLIMTWPSQRLQIMYPIWGPRLLVHPSQKIKVAIAREPRGGKARKGPEGRIRTLWTWYRSRARKTTQNPVLYQNPAFLRYPNPQRQSFMNITSMRHHPVCCLRLRFSSLTHSSSPVTQRSQPARPNPVSQALFVDVRTSQQPLEIAPPAHPPPQNQQIHTSPSGVCNPSNTAQILPSTPQVAYESPSTK